MTDAIYADLSILWDWMGMHTPPAPADVIAAFGCYDEQIPLRAAELWRQGLAPYVVFSGGLGRNTDGLFQTTEAARFAAIAMEAGLPEDVILLEDKSANSAENLLFTKALLAERGIPARRVLAVHKPYMERRLFAAAAVYWPETAFTVTSPQVSIAEHIRAAGEVGMTERGVIETVVGDVQRMELYAQKGYQIPQPIPPAVRAAWERLVAAGYTGQLIRP